MNRYLSLANNVTVSIGDITMSVRTVFALLPIGTAFKFAGNPIQFTKDSNFVARGYRKYDAGGSFIVNAIDREFSTLAMVDTIAKVDVSVQ